MYDFFSKALILDREPLGETDSYIHLLTAEYGKLSAKAKSLRKITSKLSSHLEPNSISLIRFVGKKGLHIADALKLHKKNYSWNILNLLKCFGKSAEGETFRQTAFELPTYAFLSNAYESITLAKLSYFGMKQKNKILF